MTELLSKQEIEDLGIYLTNCNGAINPQIGNIEIWFSKSRIPPWERNNRQKNNLKHRAWRIEIFKRDDYICQICGQHGGKLEAHHIKSFKEYESLRYVNSNGVTLCKKCHKEIHDN